uniref:Uncharacterized protein n=1 Tax=Octopus bimaculoides TaxID=37653 RepID=A0A0L8GYU6_OCTBM
MCTFSCAYVLPPFLTLYLCIRQIPFLFLSNFSRTHKHIHSHRETHTHTHTHTQVYLYVNMYIYALSHILYFRNLFIFTHFVKIYIIVIHTSLIIPIFQITNEHIHSICPLFYFDERKRKGEEKKTKQ